MSKINILFNNKDYLIDESAFSSASNALKSHLTNVMSGSGAVINFDGTSYNVDSTKLSNARNNFVSHIGTIAGSGSKVSINGVQYNIDSTKLSEAVSELEIVLGNLNSEGSDSDSGIAIMEERVLVFSNEDTLNYAYQEEAPSFSLEANKKYTIYWDGVSYTCVAKAIDGVIAIGNLYIDTEEVNDNTGEPFLILYVIEMDYFGIVTLDTTTNTHTVSIYPSSDESGVTILPAITLPFEPTPNFDNLYAFADAGVDLNFTQGKQYTVIFDNVVYECTFKSFDFIIDGSVEKILYAGNGDILKTVFKDYELESSSAPFALVLFEAVGNVAIVTELTDPYHTVEILG